MRVKKNWKILGSMLVLCLSAASSGAQEIKVAPAKKAANASASMMLDAVVAGKRVVAVGERGTILLSDDTGTTFRQASSSPVSFTLTGVSFSDERNGWAVGHGGTILRTIDGGENWKIQHLDLSVDQPLLSVYFADAKRGWAVGLWSLVMTTEDGGATWSKVTLPADKNATRADLNLFKVFGAGLDIYIAAEQGQVFHSGDSGASWRQYSTGGSGSLWAGAIIGRNSIVVGGLGGKILRSADGGQTWTTANAGLRASVTGLIANETGIWAATADGTIALSKDSGLSWKVQQSRNVQLTAFVGDDKTRRAFSKQGVLLDSRSGSQAP